ncbi:MAG: hypothetical protein AAF242_13885, partial [Bacteroidota bacterium]
MSNFTGDPAEDCVSAFDTTLNYLGRVFPNPVDGSGEASKALGIIKECCPPAGNTIIDTVLCNVASGSEIFLQELIPCDGIICQGNWTPVPGAVGLTYDPCNASIRVDSTFACGSFTLSSDGLGDAAQCSAFSITLNVAVDSITPPVITGDQTLCPGESAVPVTIVNAGGGTGVISFQWAVSYESDSTGFSDIPNANTLAFTPPDSLIMPGTNYFRVIGSVFGCTSVACSDSSNAIIIIAASDLVADLNDPEDPCVLGGLMDFVGSPLPVLGESTGVFSTTAMNGLNDNGDGTAQLDPQLAQAGIYEVKYVFTDSLGCMDSSIVSVTVLASPGIDSVTSRDICTGETSIELSLNGIRGAADEYTIDFDQAALTDIILPQAITPLNDSTGQITLFLPDNLNQMTYSGTIRLINSTTDCDTTLPFTFNVECDLDFGDLQDIDQVGAYPTNLTNNGEGIGAAHQIVAGFEMGLTIDQELNGQPSHAATADGSDEDGVIIPRPIYLGQTDVEFLVTVQVPSGRTARLIAWIDWNGDGQLSASESISSDFIVGNSGENQN